MRAVKTFFSGFKLSNAKIALYPWFFNFLLSIPVFYIILQFFSRGAGESVIAVDMDNRIGIFNFLVDMLHNYKGGFPIIFSMLFLLVILFMLISIFLAGGIYAVLVEGDKANFTRLISCSTENFFSMIKVFLVNIPNLAAALIVPLMPLILFSVPGLLAINESFLPFFILLWLVISTLVLIFATAIYDFSRISRLREGKNFLYSFKQGIKFTFSNKLPILVIFLFYAIFFLILYLINYLTISLLDDLPYALLIFIIYQLFILLRYYLKVTLMHAEVKLSED